jgi:REP element-mobilizing transposase RayT
MAVKYKHSDMYAMYFCTFTCYDWLQLFEITNSYDLVYKWFDFLSNKKLAKIIGYVIMPNHLHFILYFEDEKYDLNTIIGNGKRFIAYELIKRLKQLQQTAILMRLQEAVTVREKKKGQVHKVFKESFDAKPILNEPFFLQKLNYIHHNPITGKWKLAEDFLKYEHSSASFYEDETACHFKPDHYKDIS